MEAYCALIGFIAGLIFGGGIVHIQARSACRQWEKAAKFWEVVHRTSQGLKETVTPTNIDEDLRKSVMNFYHGKGEKG